MAVSKQVLERDWIRGSRTLWLSEILIPDRIQEWCGNGLADRSAVERPNGIEGR
jgi:hypothetical protein